MYIIVLGILFLFLIVTPLLFKNIKTTGFVTIFGAVLVLGIVLKIITMVSVGYSISYFNEFFYIDSLSTVQILIISCINIIVSIYSYRYISDEIEEKTITLKMGKIYYFLFNFFVFFMIFISLTNNIVAMWIGLEGTTLTTTFLFGFNINKNSLESAWKYVIICSIGIGIGLIGILIFVNAYSNQDTDGILKWSHLVNNQNPQSTYAIKIAFTLIFVGLGTKAGLAPMHTWLPDAYSDSPSPVSAMSGVLLNLALYVILRFYIITKHIPGLQNTKWLFIVFGCVSLIISSFSILRQLNYKRVLAFSSVENMGIISLGFGVGSKIAVFGAILHSLVHAFGKSMLFLTAGNLLNAYKTKRIDKIDALIKTMPINAVFLIIGMLVITGAPPFPAFFSEYYIIVGTVQSGNYIVTAIYTFCLLLVFAGFLRVFIKIVFNTEPGVKYVRMKEDKKNILPLALCFISIITISLTMNGYLSNMINNAVLIICD
ncbi:hydrogenase 4 subunit F [Clostridium estertheticum]|uniref:proton-conducting transporter transmembrane domain-containing protein n=1 Tax=Clostridium estertheticum TaxID=238834 RepID=UPI001C7D8F20|nr:proton-conducting transporter membrane subunit [Clostridium estertheticum]MBX4260688.1 hydrogenase 4 subunit F [Clostridium estertheticum]WLC70440.1 hydrogenase 4 subunit F [Clostridium estertheticum]